VSATPDFSVVVPTYGRPEALARCLAALERLDRGGPTLEVLVVDDGGAGTLDSLVAPMRRRMDVTLLRQAHAGPGAARNAGLGAARGRWVAFTDDDCTPRPGWLAGFAHRFAEHPGGGLGGRTLNHLGTNLYCAAHQVLVDYITRAAHRDAAGHRFFPSNNLAFPAEALRSLGGFDTSFPFAAGEDRDLCDRWVGSGRRLAHAPEAVVEHAHPLGLVRFCRMHHRYGRGARRFRRVVASRNGGRVSLEPSTFYVNLVLAPLFLGRSRRAFSLCAALFLSQVCHAAGYAWERCSERSPSTASRCHSSSTSRFHR